MEDYKKKYEEALGRARTFSQRWQGVEATDSELALQELKEIFPELKESEDERIRKNIISWLKNIESQTIPINDYNSAIAWLEKQGEQNIAWSEEDKKMFNYALDMIEWYSGKNEDKSRLVSNWLKSLKERVQAQLKQEWTGYDEKAYEIALLDIDKSPSITKNDTIDWLKSLKERLKGE